MNLWVPAMALAEDYDVAGPGPDNSRKHIHPHGLHLLSAVAAVHTRVPGAYR
ncbi:MAG: hypothetical protein U5R46_18740 [Gammaproteobacteria bacterium]|nr:hypothetical protein [Gammaproteobacteria bacterium]